MFADLSLGGGVTVSGEWVLLNTTIGIGADTTPSIGETLEIRAFGSKLITPVKPTTERSIFEIISSHFIIHK